MKQKKLNLENRKDIQESVNTSQQTHQSANQEERGFKINTKYNYLFILAIFIAGFIAYSNSFDCSFNFDDGNVFSNSNIIKDSATLRDWIRIYPSRPLGVLTFAANYNIHKLDVWGYHLVNLMIHLINAFLVWWLTFITFSTPVMKESSISRHKNTIAFLTGLLFVTHPLATQSVTYIYQRLASLATLFYLLSVILFVKGKLQENNKTALFLFCASIVSGVCGILTKEIVFTLPFTIILYHYCFMKTSSWKPDLKDKSLIVCFILLVILILFFLRNFSLDIFNTVEPRQGYSYSISMKEYFLTQFSVILTYLRLFILPINQNLDYDYQLSTGFFQLKTFFSFSLLLGILSTGVLLFKRYLLISFGIFWLFLTMSVESSIIPISQNVIFEHRTYLPGFGFFLGLTSAFFYFFKEKYLKIAVIILLTIAILNTILTYQRNKIWKNEYTLWADCVKKSPNKARPNNNLCFALFPQGRFEEAINYCSRAIRTKPDFAEAYNNRGRAYDALTQYQQAIEDYSKAIRLQLDYVDAYNNRGISYQKIRQYPLAIEDYSKAIRLNPNHAYACNNRGSVYFTLGQYQQAIEDYSKAIDLQPDYVEAYKNRSSIYFTQGQKSLGCNDAQKACAIGDCSLWESAKSKGFCLSENSETAIDWINKEQTLWNGSKYTDPTKAIEYLDNAIKLQQNNAAYYLKRGTAYYNLGNHQRAIEDYSEAIRLRPDYSMAYYNRGSIYVKNPDQYKQAIKDFNKAINLKPDYTEAYNNLGGIYLIQGKKSLGCSNAQKACELGKCKLLEVAKGQGYCR